MRIAVFGLFLAVFLVLPLSSATQDVSPLNLVSQDSWKLAREKTLTNRKPDENDMAELLARLVVVSSGEDLPQEALKKTIHRANDLSGGYGMWDNGGNKRMFAMFILSAYDQSMKLKQYRSQLQAQQSELEIMRTEINILKAAVIKNGK